MGRLLIKLHRKQHSIRTAGPLPERSEEAPSP